MRRARAPNFFVIGTYETISDDDDNENVDVARDDDGTSSATSPPNSSSDVDDDGSDDCSSDDAYVPAAKKPRRTGVGARKAFIATLSALPRAQLLETLADYFGPGGPGDMDEFKRALPAPNTDALIKDLTAAARAISKAQPRYKNGDSELAHSQRVHSLEYT